MSPRFLAQGKFRYYEWDSAYHNSFEKDFMITDFASLQKELSYITKTQNIIWLLRLPLPRRKTFIKNLHQISAQAQIAQNLSKQKGQFDKFYYSRIDVSYSCWLLL